MYIDTWAMKHMFYSTDDYSVKQPAGALSGNSGSAKEWSMLRVLLAKGIPSVLCDLTNTIRYGDVCVLVGPDPYPVEIKSSKNINARTARQASNLKALHDFLAKDQAAKFRGLHNVERKEMPTPSFNLESLNECIERSRSEGYALISPEPGLTYICIRSALPPNESMEFGSRHLVGDLSEFLMNAAWMPYRPFTLSIFNPESVADFISGEILLLVVVDTKFIENSLFSKGLSTTFVDHPLFIATLTRLDSQKINWSAITRHLFTRIFLEFFNLSETIKIVSNSHAEFEAMPPSYVTQEEANALLSNGQAVYSAPVYKPLFRSE